MNQQFDFACRCVIGQNRERRGIGTLSEKTLHAVLKQYYAGETLEKEVKIGSYVADLADPALEQGIIEIQTGGFDRLRQKLDYFLSLSDVTVVYPIAQVKWLCWLDPETGEITSRRKSPKQRTVCDAFYELYKIKPLLPHPRLHFCFPLMELAEYRFLNGWSRDRKKGSSRYERIPTKLLAEVRIETAADFAKLIPSGLPEPFTSRDFAKAARLSASRSCTALNVLTFLGRVVRTGKSGNSYLYQTAPTDR